MIAPRRPRIGAALRSPTGDRHTPGTAPPHPTPAPPSTVPAAARPDRPPPQRLPRPSALGLAARWVGVTNLALLGVILLVTCGDALGRWVVVASTALLSAAWAGVCVGLLQAWRRPLAAATLLPARHVPPVRR